VCKISTVSRARRPSRVIWVMRVRRVGRDEGWEGKEG
jgi:hypothetical protein